MDTDSRQDTLTTHNSTVKGVFCLGQIECTAGVHGVYKEMGIFYLYSGCADQRMPPRHPTMEHNLLKVCGPITLRALIRTSKTSRIENMIFCSVSVWWQLG